MPQSTSKLGLVLQSKFTWAALVTLFGSVGAAALLNRYYGKDTEESSSELKSQRDLMHARHLEFQGLNGIFSYESKLSTIGINESKDVKYFLPVGLPNLGSTCYMNALFQALTGSVTFMNYVHKLWDNLSFYEDENSVITLQFLSLLLDLEKGLSYTNPRDFYNTLCGEQFTEDNEQMDSHELLIFIQDRITKITANHLRKSTFDQGLACSDLLTCDYSNSIGSEQHELEQDLGAIEDLFDEPKPIEKQTSGRLFKGILQIKDLMTNKIIGLNPFAGVYLSTIQCQRCGPSEELHRWEVFYDLSLEVQNTLEESLSQYFKSEQIEDYICIKCSLKTFLSNYPENPSNIQNSSMREVISFLQKMRYVHDLDEESFQNEWKKWKKNSGNTSKVSIDKLTTKITKKFSVATPPKIMCFHFKRIYYNQHGNMVLNRQRIKYPRILKLSNIKAIQGSCYEVDSTYRLSGVIEHIGSVNGGHYVSYKRLLPSATSLNEKWVVCDDSKVELIPEGSQMNIPAYMLFYEKVAL